MAAPYLVACLVQLRTEFDEIEPRRDDGADGWIGDKAHQSEVSDHNPDSVGRVLAVDIDSTGPWTDVTFDDLVEWVVGRQRSEADARLEYVIWNRRIASRTSGWAWRTYTGTADPHTGHAHFSARHDHAGNTSSAPWYLEEVMLTDATIGKIVSAVWAAGFGSGATRETSGERLGHVDQLVDAIADRLDEIETKVDALAK